MKTEIGLFDDWAKINIENYCDAIFDGRYYVMRENSRLTKEKKNFLILSLNIGLKSWRASASREGYKLVPLQPSNAVIVAIENKVKNQLEASGINQDPFRLDGETIYKAVIGASDA